MFNLKENGINGTPDGMTMDNNGNLWVACYFSGLVSILYIYHSYQSVVIPTLK